eukprot:CAMPEP_0115848192 /NCGR_PEP_ID=MMETSP0287-20121206/10789_1 /TAXON_ID=412157 /ORGANISM="Chrysochromulina rotalis, Strain UIO044" /LENGTH=91 /DNA_ID=CAMNT_0003302085 /DNA_START=130 /DNA_END=405 /DNA_ORIENTATION=+
MGSGQSQPMELSREESRRLRELSVVTALLLGLHNRHDKGDRGSPHLAPSGLNGSSRSNQSSPAVSASRTPKKEPPARLPPIKPQHSASYDA